jgi:putative inorganic carbon (hco3(-)) transporter
MAFWFPFLNFMQPGILFPALQPFKPMLLAAILTGIASLQAGKHLAEQRSQCLRHPAFLWLCFFMFVNVISVYYSGVSSMIEEFGYWNIYPIFVFVSMLIMKDEAALRRYIWGLVLGGSVVIGMGIFLWAIQSPLLPGGRAGAYGMYENHNDYTFMILLVMPYAYLMITSESSRLLKLVLLIVVGACTLGVLASLSRGGILTLVAEFAMLFWVTTRGSRRIVGLVALGLIGAAVIVHQFAAREENQAGNYSAEDAKNSRYELWRAAEAMIKVHPILGVGARRFHEYSQDYAEISHDNRGKVAHNTFLEIAADTGVLGFGSFMAMMVALLRSLRVPAQPHESPFLRLIKRATLITLVAILFRSSLDAKVHDWSFYTLAAIGIVTTVLARLGGSQSSAARAESAGVTAQPVGIADTPELVSRPRAAAPAGASIRPSVYGRHH